MRLLIIILLLPILFLSCNTEEVDITDAHMAIYPNPFNDRILISINAINSSEAEINIYGDLGKPSNPQIQYSGLIPDENPVIQETIPKNEEKNYQIEASGWDSGTYIMDVTINGKTERFNLIKM